jgi:hypothetical protein
MFWISFKALSRSLRWAYVLFFSIFCYVQSSNFKMNSTPEFFQFKLLHWGCIIASFLILKPVYNIDNKQLIYAENGSNTIKMLLIEIWNNQNSNISIKSTHSPMSIFKPSFNVHSDSDIIIYFHTYHHPNITNQLQLYQFLLFVFFL